MSLNKSRRTQQINGWSVLRPTTSEVRKRILKAGLRARFFLLRKQVARLRFVKVRPLNKRSLVLACDELAVDPRLRVVHERYGVPPLWNREPGFATLLQIILEQQVSLA